VHECLGLLLENAAGDKREENRDGVWRGGRGDYD